MANKVVFRNIGQVLDTLRRHNHLPPVAKLLEINRAQVGVGNDEVILPKYSDHSPHPLLVVEGLDGCGKTTLTKFLSESLGLNLMATPPKMLMEFRKFFDSQPEHLRRAYYSLGNYIAGRQVVDGKLPVVMDRFWHSTAAFAMAHKMRGEGSFDKIDNGLVWPTDLLKPDLVLFLQVSEEERIRRHGSREVVTSTPEEKMLARDKDFRRNLLAAIRGIKGVPFLEVNVDGEKPDVQKRVLKLVTETLPSLRELDLRSQTRHVQY